MSNLIGPNERMMEKYLASVAEYVIVQDVYPRTQISIILQLISDDGGSMAACANAMIMALIDAGVAMHRQVAATTLAFDSNEWISDPHTVAGVKKQVSIEDFATLCVVMDAQTKKIVACSMSSSMSPDPLQWWSLVEECTYRTWLRMREISSVRIQETIGQ